MHAALHYANWKKKKRAVIMVLYLSGIKLIFSRSCWVRVSSPSPITEHVNELLSVSHSEQDRGDGKCWHSCLLTHTHTHTQGRPSPSVSRGHRGGEGSPSHQVVLHLRRRTGIETLRLLQQRQQVMTYGVLKTAAVSGDTKLSKQ